MKTKNNSDNNTESIKVKSSKVKIFPITLCFSH